MGVAVASASCTTIREAARPVSATYELEINGKTVQKVKVVYDYDPLGMPLPPKPVGLESRDAEE